MAYFNKVSSNFPLNKRGKFILFGSVFLLINSLISEAQIVKGADIGWLSQMEATGYQFYDTTNVPSDCLSILRERAINTVRLRVWVNPSEDRINGHCSKKEVTAMALRAKNMGMRVLIDFHYSDSWADPSKQTKPAAWANDSLNQLLSDLYNHTYDVLDTIESLGVKPEWVQVGNEITNGMLWPDGSTSNWGQLAQLINKGYDATKAVDSTIKVIIHLDQGNNNTRFRTFFDSATNRGVRYDIIGASYYPYWLGSDYSVTINDLGNNLIDMTTRYGKQVMVVEVGGLYSQVQNTYDMISAVIQKIEWIPNNMGLGVIYWEPEGELSWSGYNLSSWDSIGVYKGEPTRALFAFLESPTGINLIKGRPGITINPNPCSDLLTLTLNEYNGNKLIASIANVNGKIIRSQSVSSNITILDVSDLSNGTYMISIFDENSNLLFSKIIIKN